MIALILWTTFLSHSLLAQDYIFTIRSSRIQEDDTLELDDEPSHNTDFTFLDSNLGLSSTQSSGYSGVTTLRFRGLPAGSTKVLFEGLDLTDPTSINSEVQLQHLNSSSMRAEFSNLSSPTISGSQSSGGTLQLQLVKDNNASLSYGSDNTSEAAINFYDTKNKKYFFHLSIFNTDGISQSIFPGPSNELEDDSSQKIQVATIFNDETPNFKFSLKYFGNFHYYQVDSFNFSLNQSEDLISSEKSYNEKHAIGLFLNSENWKLTTSLTDHFTFDSSLNQTTKAQSQKVFFQRNFNKLQTIVELQRSELTSDAGIYNNPISKSEVHTASLSALLPIKLNNFILTPSTRLDRNELFGNHISYQVVLERKWKNIKAALSHSRGFNAPSLYQLYSSYGNKSLEPEITNSIDSEISWNYKKYKTTLHTYYIDYQNQINYLINKFVNYKKSFFKGFETSHQYQFNQIFKLQFNYSYNHAYQDGQQLLKVPFHRLNAIFNYKLKGFNLLLDQRFVSQRMDFSKKELEPYFITNLNLSYLYQKKYILEFIVHNLFDKNYHESFGYQMRDRSFYAKATYKF